MTAQVSSLPSIALVYGRGIEGCGVTRWGAELQDWIRHRCGTCDVYAYGRKSFLRGDAQSIDYKPFSGDDKHQLVNTLNQYDIVIYTSVPVAQTPVDDLTAFYELIHRVTRPIKCFFSFENTTMLLKKTPYLPLIINDVDQVFGLQCRPDSWLRQRCAELDKELMPIKNWMDFSRFLGKKFEDKGRGLLYIGRNSTFKNLPLTLELGRHFQRLSPGYPVRFMGVEAGQATMRWLESEEGVVYHYDDDNIARWARDGTIHFWNFYNYRDGMEAMAGTKFGVSLAHIEPEDGEGINHTEYAMMEIIALGSIPIFNRRWVETTTVNGMPLSERPRFCLQADPADLEVVAKEALNLTNMAAARLHAHGMQFLMEEYDANTHIPAQLQLIVKRGKQRQKWEGDDDCLAALSGNGQYGTRAFGVNEALHRYSDIENLRICRQEKRKAVPLFERRDFR